MKTEEIFVSSFSGAIGPQRLAPSIEDENRQLRITLEKAVAFIDSHVADPDITDGMCVAYREYQESMKAFRSDYES